MPGPRQLLVFGFEPGATFEGDLLTAMERIELDPDAAVLDALFVARDAAEEGIQAVDLQIGGGDRTLASLLDFRLDPRRRRALTDRTLAEHPGGVPRASIEAVADTLDPGAAVLAVLLAGRPPAVLGDAVARCGGHLLRREPLEAVTALGQVPQLLLPRG